MLGLTDNQVGYARGIVTVVRGRRLPIRAAQIALETALTESGLRMYANKNNPRSLQLPHDAVGSDHRSVGLFQQQVTGPNGNPAGWGTTEQLMDPKVSCDKFLNALGEKWRNQANTNWEICQAVQHSAFADGSNYRKHDGLAGQLANQLWGNGNQPPVHPDYVVKSGDNLTKIASRYPEAWITAASIAKANIDRHPSLAHNPNLIEVGWRLRIR